MRNIRLAGWLLGCTHTPLTRSCALCLCSFAWLLLQIAVGILLKFDFELDATKMLYAGPTIALICLYVAGFAWSW